MSRLSLGPLPCTWSGSLSLRPVPFQGGAARPGRDLLPQCSHPLLLGDMSYGSTQVVQKLPEGMAWKPQELRTSLTLISVLNLRLRNKGERDREAGLLPQDSLGLPAVDRVSVQNIPWKCLTGDPETRVQSQSPEPAHRGSGGQGCERQDRPGPQR